MIVHLHGPWHSLSVTESNTEQRPVIIIIIILSSLHRECIHVFVFYRWCLGVEILSVLQHLQLMKVLSGQQHIRYTSTLVVNSISCLTSQCSLGPFYQKRGHLTYAFLRLIILKAECK